MTLPWHEDESLAQHTTLQVGGPAKYFVRVESEAELAAVAREARHRGEPILVLGGGSNVLINDSGFAGVVIENRLTGIHETVRENNTVELTVGAGEVFDDLVAYAVERGYWGLENLSHIPGSVGATPIQNVGAYGSEVSQLITGVRVFDSEHETFIELTHEDCQFGYRDSMFKTPAGQKYIVTAATFAVTRTPRPDLTYRDLVEYFKNQPQPTVAAIRHAVIDIRSRKFPDWHTTGTAGSFFKNPVISAPHFARLQKDYPELPGYPTPDGHVKVSLAYILDKLCGLRGHREGNVGLYEAQALVLVNYGGATAEKIDTFAKEVSQKVFATTEIVIEREVTNV